MRVEPGDGWRPAGKKRACRANRFRSRGSYEARTFPGFRWSQALETRRACRSFFLEYLPQFLQNWHAGRDPRAGGIRRQDILARYAAVLQAAPMERLLQDVHAVEVCLTGAEERALLSGARLLGAGTRILSDGSSVTAGRFHLRIRRENSPGQRGRRMALRLRGKPPRQTLILGSSRLEILENGTAAWTFGPAAQR